MVISRESLAALQAQPALLAELASADLSAANTLPLLTQLRKRYPPDLAAAALESARLRQRGAAKFSRAAAMFFTEDALQQATHEAVAAYHAALLADFAWVADLGCSIGGDAVQLGQQRPVLGLDRDLLRLNMARHNATVYGAALEPVQADLTQPLPLQPSPESAAFFDPARRSAQRRIFSVEDYQPALHHAFGWRFPAMLIKISPGVQLAELADYPVGLEFVSYQGDLKEALLHVGGLAFRGIRASCLPDGGTLLPQGLPPPPVASSPRRYLYEPDPALIRAGLFGEALAHLGLEAFRLDESIAYLTGDVPVVTPWLRCWRIDEWLPFHLKKLRARLREKGVGSVTVKKRGSPILPEELQKMLKLKGNGQHALIVLTQLQGQPITLLSYDEAGTV